MHKRKPYKVYRKFQNNLHNNLKFSYFVYKNLYKKRWFFFKKPLYNKNQKNLLKVSKFFSTDHKEKQINKYINCNSKFVSSPTIAYSLLITKFVRSYSEAKFIVNSGFIYVNDKKIRSIKYLLKKGDTVEIKTLLINEDIKKTEFFSKKKHIIIEVNYRPIYEISYALNIFVYCYLIFFKKFKF